MKFATKKKSKSTLETPSAITRSLHRYLQGVVSKYMPITRTLQRQQILVFLLEEKFNMLVINTTWNANGTNSYAPDSSIEYVHYKRTRRHFQWFTFLSAKILSNKTEELVKKKLNLLLEPVKLEKASMNTFRSVTQRAIIKGCMSCFATFIYLITTPTSIVIKNRTCRYSLR